MRTVSESVLARPIRSPTEPKIRPPSAQPATKMLCAQPLSCFNTSASVPGAARALTALSRAKMKSCWSRQSKSHASEATVKTNQWLLDSVRYQGRVAAAGDDIVGESVLVFRGPNAPDPIGRETRTKNPRKNEANLTPALTPISCVYVVATALRAIHVAQSAVSSMPGAPRRNSRVPG